MILEILAGAGLALICVLVWQGINVAPVVVLAVMFALLYHFAGLRNGGRHNSLSWRQAKVRDWLNLTK